MGLVLSVTLGVLLPVVVIAAVVATVYLTVMHPAHGGALFMSPTVPGPWQARSTAVGLMRLRGTLVDGAHVQFPEQFRDAFRVDVAAAAGVSVDAVDVLSVTSGSEGGSVFPSKVPDVSVKFRVSAPNALSVLDALNRQTYILGSKLLRGTVTRAARRVNYAWLDMFTQQELDQLCTARHGLQCRNGCKFSVEDNACVACASQQATA